MNIAVLFRHPTSEYTIGGDAGAKPCERHPGREILLVWAVENSFGRPRKSAGSRPSTLRKLYTSLLAPGCSPARRGNTKMQRIMKAPMATDEL